ncbi:hypothetical protein CJ030_MR1G014014 [Morella rubra]|uniref:Uncharacterized protein n=1 Tax=Morella rubra TaxID=262757 RepID=A0A6A1WQ79_9ROSI|nr:hypothetical protein CJ030_MR1G014014 [Morella rubra]
MGNWRHRPGRRIFRQQRAAWSPPREFDPDHPPEWKDGVPLWEKQFCTLVGSIPWGKVVDTKKFISCHNNVVRWDDSAGEEAFQTAKKRFWAKINGIHCDISVSDPDIYIDEIDWNPYIDPELIEELDRDWFDPDDKERNAKVRCKNRSTKHYVALHSEGHAMNQAHDGNPGECNNMQESGALQNKAQGWNQWENNTNGCRNLGKDCNPWEHVLTQGNGDMMDNAWGNWGDKSWSFTQVGNQANQSREWDEGDNPLEHGCQVVAAMMDRGFGSKGWDWNLRESKNFGNGNNPWESRHNANTGAVDDRGRRDCGGKAWGWKQRDNDCNNTNYEFKHQEFVRNGGGWGTRDKGCRKREVSHPHMMGTKSSRFQGNGNQRGYCWRRAQTKKTVSFAPE